RHGMARQAPPRRGDRRVRTVAPRLPRGLRPRSTPRGGGPGRAVGRLLRPRSRRRARAGDLRERGPHVQSRRDPDADLASPPPPRAPAERIEQTTQLPARATAAGPNTQAVVDANYNLGIAYALADQPERALEHYQEAAALGERLDLREAKLANALAQSAMILVELGRPREAVPVARRAVAMAEALAVDSELGSALTVLGSALLETGQTAAAREPLRRALPIRDHLAGSGRVRGDTRFLLATAAWGVDRT